MDLTIHPLTPDRWPALEDLFGKGGASSGCWCMYWRIGPAYHRRQRDLIREVARRTSARPVLRHDLAEVAA